MSKPTIRRVPSDDCEVDVGGETFNPHEGEWVEIQPGASIRELKSLWAFDRLSTDLDNLSGEPDEKIRTLERLEVHFDALTEWVGRRVKAWNWTDDENQLMPQPDGTATPMRELKPQELYYLRRILRGEGPADRLNASPPSQTISSATESAQTPKEQLPTSGRSRTKS